MKKEKAKDLQHLRQMAKDTLEGSPAEEKGESKQVELSEDGQPVTGGHTIHMAPKKVVVHY